MIVAKRRPWKRWMAVFAAVTLSIAAACIGDQTAQLNVSPLTSEIIEVSGMATEIVIPHISMNTAKGPLVLRVNAGTGVLKFDGSPGMILDIRPGMNIKVSYNSSTLTCLQIQIMPLVMSANIQVAGVATEIVPPHISLNTVTGPLVLKIDGNTTFVRGDGSPAMVTDVRPGMTVNVSYDSSTLVCRQIIVGPVPASTTIEITGTATEIVSPHISISTVAGPLVLKLNAGTTFWRLDGAPVGMTDIRPGMNVKVTYDPSTLICGRIQIQ